MHLNGLARAQGLAPLLPGLLDLVGGTCWILSKIARSAIRRSLFTELGDRGGPATPRSAFLFSTVSALEPGRAPGRWVGRYRADANMVITVRARPSEVNDFRSNAACRRQAPAGRQRTFRMEGAMLAITTGSSF